MKVSFNLVMDGVHHSPVVDEAFFHEVNGEVMGVEMRCNPQYLPEVLKYSFMKNRILTRLRVEIGDEFKHVVFDDDEICIYNTDGYERVAKENLQSKIEVLKPSSLVLMAFFPTKIMDPISIEEASGIILPYSDEGFVFFIDDKENFYKLPIAKASFSKNKVRKAKQVLKAKYRGL